MADETKDLVPEVIVSPDPPSGLTGPRVPEESIGQAATAHPDTALPASQKPTSAKGRMSARRGPRKPLDPGDKRVIRRRVDALKARIAGLPSGLPDSSQDLIGKLTLTLPAIDEEEAYQLLDVVDVAASAFSTDPPNVKLARRILDGVERSLLLRRKIRYLMQGFGLGLLFTVALTVLIMWLTPTSIGFDRVELGLVAVAGFIGASVSLAIKIKDYARLKEIDTRVLRWTAFFKPLIGMAFALFVYMALNSGIIDINLAGTERTFFFVAVAFVAGFSERFAQDVISRVEQTTGATSNEPTPGAEDEAKQASETSPSVLSPQGDGAQTVPRHQ